MHLPRPGKFSIYVQSVIGLRSIDFHLYLNLNSIIAVKQYNQRLDLESNLVFDLPSGAYWPSTVSESPLTKHRVA